VQSGFRLLRKIRRSLRSAIDAMRIRNAASILERLGRAKNSVYLFHRARQIFMNGFSVRPDSDFSGRHSIRLPVAPDCLKDFCRGSLQIGEELLQVQAVFFCNILKGIKKGLAADAFTGLFIVFLKYILRLLKFRYYIQNGHVGADSYFFIGHGFIHKFPIFLYFSPP
jgi:hypothetical protein